MSSSPASSLHRNPSGKGFTRPRQMLTLKRRSRVGFTPSGGFRDQQQGGGMANSMSPLTLFSPTSGTDSAALAEAFGLDKEAVESVAKEQSEVTILREQSLRALFLRLGAKDPNDPSGFSMELVGGIDSLELCIEPFRHYLHKSQRQFKRALTEAKHSLLRQKAVSEEKLRHSTETYSSSGSSSDEDIFGVSLDEQGLTRRQRIRKEREEARLASLAAEGAESAKTVNYAEFDAIIAQLEEVEKERQRIQQRQLESRRRSSLLAQKRGTGAPLAVSFSGELSSDNQSASLTKSSANLRGGDKALSTVSSSSGAIEHDKSTEMQPDGSESSAGADEKHKQQQRSGSYYALPSDFSSRRHSTSAGEGGLDLSGDGLEDQQPNKLSVRGGLAALVAVSRFTSSLAHSKRRSLSGSATHHHHPFEDHDHSSGSEHHHQGGGGAGTGGGGAGTGGGGGIGVAAADGASHAHHPPHHHLGASGLALSTLSSGGSASYDHPSLADQMYTEDGEMDYEACHRLIDTMAVAPVGRANILYYPSKAKKNNYYSPLPPPPPPLRITTPPSSNPHTANNNKTAGRPFVIGTAKPQRAQSARMAGHREKTFPAPGPEQGPSAPLKTKTAGTGTGTTHHQQSTVSATAGTSPTTSPSPPRPRTARAAGAMDESQPLPHAYRSAGPFVGSIHGTFGPGTKTAPRQRPESSPHYRTASRGLEESSATEGPTCDVVAYGEDSALQGAEDEELMTRDAGTQTRLLPSGGQQRPTPQQDYLGSRRRIVAETDPVEMPIAPGGGTPRTTTEGLPSTTVPYSVVHQVLSLRGIPVSSSPHRVRPSAPHSAPSGRGAQVSPSRGSPPAIKVTPSTQQSPSRNRVTPHYRETSPECMEVTIDPPQQNQYSPRRPFTAGAALGGPSPDRQQLYSPPGVMVASTLSPSPPAGGATTPGPGLPPRPPHAAASPRLSPTGGREKESGSDSYPVTLLQPSRYAEGTQFSLSASGVAPPPLQCQAQLPTAGEEGDPSPEDIHQQTLRSTVCRNAERFHKQVMSFNKVDMEMAVHSSFSPSPPRPRACLSAHVRGAHAGRSGEQQPQQQGGTYRPSSALVLPHQTTYPLLFTAPMVPADV